MNTTGKQFSDKFDTDVYTITVESSIEAKDVPGGTASSRVESAIQSALQRIKRSGRY